MIHMQPDLSKITFLVGDRDTLLNMPHVPVLPVFSDLAVSFLSDLSKSILGEKKIRTYKDVMGYAYWIRRASIVQYKENITRLNEKMGRGVAYHIAPSNIPVQFAVSMVPAFLAGNACIIRVSNREFEQVNIICDKMKNLFCGQYRHLAKYFCIIRYDHDDAITEWLSSFCDVRIIWGGNGTIRSIRRFPIPVRAAELTFADRYSLAIIDSDALMETDIRKVIEGFWLDTYFVDQNACSSPRIVIWTGGKIKEARKIFWDSLHAKAEEEYQMSPGNTIDRFLAFAQLSMSMDGIRLESKDNYIFRVLVDKPNPEIMDYKAGGGYFFEYFCKELEEIISLLNDKSCQTVALFGVNPAQIRKMIFQYGLKGVDRIVRLGSTTAPGLDWDGYSLIDAMSRIVGEE